MCDCELPQCYVHETPRARKPHRCCECHGTIQPGETYHHHHGIWDYEPEDYRVCVDCEALRADIDRDAKADDRTPLGWLSEHVYEYRQGDPMRARFSEIQRKRGSPAVKADGMVARFGGRKR